MSRYFPALEEALESLRDGVTRAVGEAAPGIRELGAEMLRERASLARSGLLLASAGLCGAPPSPRLLGLAEVLELVHLASSLHDEGLAQARILEEAGGDGGWSRRGAILLGDLLLARSMQLLAEHGDPDSVATVAAVTGDLAEGRIVDATLDGESPSPSCGTRLRAAELVSGSFFGHAAALGARLADAPPSDAADLEAFGRAIGVAFHVVSRRRAETPVDGALAEAATSGVETARGLLTALTARQRNVTTLLHFLEEIERDLPGRGA